MTTTSPSPSRVSSKALIGVLLAGCVGLVIFLGVQLTTGGGPSLGTKSAAAACAPQSGEACLPDVTYVDTNGVAYTPQSLAGKVVVINFWATWCTPCLRELPDLSKVSERFKDRGVVVLGILTNDNPDNNTLLNFQSDNNISFPTIRGSSQILAAYDYPPNLPTTFVFDRGGRRVQHKVGALSAERLADMLEPLAAAN